MIYAATKRMYTVDGERLAPSEVWDRYVGNQSPDEFMYYSDTGSDNYISAACAYAASLGLPTNDENAVADAIEDYLMASLGER